MFKQCELHIGTEKTGTTSVQRSFRIYRGFLKKNSVFTPQSMGRLEHVDIVSMIADSDKVFSRRVLVGATTEDLIKKHKVLLNEQISEELSSASKKFDRLVISSERLATMITRPHELDNLLNFLEHWCEDIRVICYLRPQHEFAVSALSTRLRHGAQNLNPFPESSPETGSLASLCYGDLLDFWLTRFDKDKITVRTFERSRMEGGDTVVDFFATLGLPLPPNFIVPEPENSSLSAEGQIFLSKLNKYIPTLLKKKNPQGPTNIVGHVNRLYPGKGLQPSKAQAKAFFNQFESQNDRVRGIWFKDRHSLFDVSFDKFPSRATSKKLSEDRVFQMFSELYASMAEK